ncbi:MAG: hypothetical protein HQK51_10440 [Oligoflexia bacterium]|nr:hypothetical protein [Oligoflexia bacterium]
MSIKIEFTQEEINFRKKNKETYNKGDMKSAYEEAVEFYKANPNSIIAKYCYAVMSGDYSYDLTLSKERAAELLEVAKKHIKELYLDERSKNCPGRWYSSIRNEYYWFYKLHEEQYNLGVEDVANGDLGGSYSMCVGAASMANKCLLENNDIDSAKKWANKSISAFNEFEKVDPTWYNINYFYAEALNVLGKYDDALVAFKGMYQKQGSPVNEKEIADFMERTNKVKEKIKTILEL